MKECFNKDGSYTEEYKELWKRYIEWAKYYKWMFDEWPMTEIQEKKIFPR